jgi:hypothetical protein
MIKQLVLYESGQVRVGIIIFKQLGSTTSRRFKPLSAFAFIQSFVVESHLNVGTTFFWNPFLINKWSTRSASHKRISIVLSNHCFAHLCQSVVGSICCLYNKMSSQTEISSRIESNVVITQRMSSLKEIPCYAQL